jgi:hypothetical protein
MCQSLTEMKALRELEATRSQDLEKSREILLITSRILEEQASRASEDSQEIAHAAALDAILIYHLEVRLAAPCGPRSISSNELRVNVLVTISCDLVGWPAK